MKWLNLFQSGTLPLFRLAVKVVINVLVLIIIAVLFLGLWQVIIQIRNLFHLHDLNTFITHTVANILSLLVVIEIFKGFIEYQEIHRFRLHSLIDSGFVFVLRELFVELFEGKILHQFSAFLGFACIFLSLGIVRSLAIKISPK